MLRGISTLNFFADDVAAARAWYAEVLGVDAYFAREIGGALAYAEFRVGDLQQEMGIVDRRFAPGGPVEKPGGALASTGTWTTSAPRSTGCSSSARRPSSRSPNGAPAS